MERMVTQADIDAYQASLIDMTDEQLLDELEMCARSNTFGSHASQRTHEHGIPKTARPVGPRMSVVYRVRP